MKIIIIFWPHIKKCIHAFWNWNAPCFPRGFCQLHIIQTDRHWTHQLLVAILARDHLCTDLKWRHVSTAGWWSGSVVQKKNTKCESSSRFSLPLGKICSHQAEAKSKIGRHCRVAFSWPDKDVWSFTSQWKPLRLWEKPSDRKSQNSRKRPETFETERRNISRCGRRKGGTIIIIITREPLTAFGVLHPGGGDTRQVIYQMGFKKTASSPTDSRLNLETMHTATMGAYSRVTRVSDALICAGYRSG